jgi:hypothetical protein
MKAEVNPKLCYFIGGTHLIKAFSKKTSVHRAGSTFGVFIAVPMFQKKTSRPHDEFVDGQGDNKDGLLYKEGKIAKNPGSRCYSGTEQLYDNMKLGQLVTLFVLALKSRT